MNEWFIFHFSLLLFVLDNYCNIISLRTCGDISISSARIHRCFSMSDLLDLETLDLSEARTNSYREVTDGKKIFGFSLFDVSGKFKNSSS